MDGTDAPDQGEQTARLARPPRRGGGPSRAVVTVVVVVGVLAVLASGVLLWVSRTSASTASSVTSSPSGSTAGSSSSGSSSSGSSSVSSSVSSSSSPSESATLPVGAQACPGGANAGHRAAAGNDTTSCAFALNVRDTYVASGADGSSEVTLQVNSPVTRKNYEMTCSGSPLVTCRGGKGALVYLY